MRRTNIDSKGVKIPGDYLALCPLDGRYSQIRDEVGPYISEYALQRWRLYIEVEWLIFVRSNVCEIPDNIPQITEDDEVRLRGVANNFSVADFERLKELEKVKKHDVKVVEYFLDEKLDEVGLGGLKSYVHIGLTSEDVTNLAYSAMIREVLEECWCPVADEFLEHLKKAVARSCASQMLAHTHGQPATPTTVGKELAVFHSRLSEQLDYIRSLRQRGKLNGATGNFASLAFAFPHNDWPKLSKEFVEEIMGLEYNPLTTQIEDHARICRTLDGVRAFNNALYDYNQDMWLYISNEYFVQVAKPGEVGSSTMPNKVNPISHENAKGNIKVGNGVCTAISDALPVSKWQRELTDSTILRNLGMAFGYSLQSIRESIKAIQKSDVNPPRLEEDLNGHYEVISEAIQTLLRRYGDADAYDTLKDLTRGKPITRAVLHDFVTNIPADILPVEEKQRLYALAPHQYIGYSEELASSLFGNKD